MGIFTRFKRRKELDKQLHFRNGFGWAMASYYLDDAPIELLRGTAMSAIDYDNFDRGIEAAAEILEAVERQKMLIKQRGTS